MGGGGGFGVMMDGWMHLWIMLERRWMGRKGVGEICKKQYIRRVSGREGGSFSLYAELL